MPTKIIFTQGEPEEVIVEKNVSDDSRLKNNEGNQAIVIDGSKESWITFVSNENIVLRQEFLQDQSRTGEDLGLPNVESINRYSEERQTTNDLGIHFLGRRK